MIPKLPTDSLYKFVAVAGIAVFVTGAILLRQSFQTQLEIESRFPSIERTAGDVYRHGDGLRERHEASMAELDDIIDRYSKITDEDELKSARSAIQEKMARTMELGETRVRWTEDRDALEDELARFKGRLSSYTATRLWGILFVVSGIGISSFGFGLWYVRIQRFVDLQIMNSTIGEQGGGVQSATAPESKTEGNEKPKPESEAPPQ